MNATHASLMTHLVAGYPREGADEEVARALVRGGASFLELQFPYSDPTADGPAIQEACQVALDAGFRVRYGFDLVRRIAEATQVPIFIMSYAGLVFARGVETFVQEASAAGARALIVPDLPLDSDEGLLSAARDAGIAIVPVTVATASLERLEALRPYNPEYLYVALRAGTTGSETRLSRESVRFLDAAREVAGHVMGGFGISRREQVEALLPHCHSAVVGSAIVRAIKAAEPHSAATAAEALVRHLAWGEA